MLRTVRRLNPVALPQSVLSLQVFLTYDCNYDCPSCTNKLVARKNPRTLMTAEQWIEGLSRFNGHVSVTLRGGEPSLHPGLFDILQMLPARAPVKFVTNLSFDVTDLVGRVDPTRLNRHPSWAPIRATFHLGKSDPEEMLAKVMTLEEAGFRVGLLAMDAPGQELALRSIQKWFLSWGIDFRIRSFVGYADGRLMGAFGYPDAAGQPDTREAACRSTEMSIAPDGRLYYCRRDCFAESGPVGHILDAALPVVVRHSPCRNYGACHPCDVELRPTVFGGIQRTAVEILPLD